MAFANLGFYGLLWRNQGLRWLLKIPEKQEIPSAENQNVASAKSALYESIPTKPRFSLPEILPVEAWPEQWQKMLQRTKPYKIVWTYEQLGQDLMGVPDAGLSERHKFLATLLKDIGHKGTNTFWPLTLPEMEADPRFFWSGIKSLKSHYVMLLGEKAVCQAGLQGQIKVGAVQVLEDYVIYACVSLEKLTEDKAQYNILLNTVKKLLNTIKRESHV